jgi:hypothetical protein
VPDTLHPDKTHIALSLKTAIIISGGLLAGGASAMAGFLAVKYEIQGLRERVDFISERAASELATKGDVERLRGNIKEIVANYLHAAVAKCPPYVIRGQGYTLCEIIPVQR